MIVLVFVKYAIMDLQEIVQSCNCCNNSDLSHSMVLDGIEGFTYKVSDRNLDEE